MMRNANCRNSSRFAFYPMKFNRFVIVEFQFTFHYGDKCLGNEFKNLLCAKNTIKHFSAFEENSFGVFIHFEMQKDQQKKYLSWKFLHEWIWNDYENFILFFNNFLHKNFKQIKFSFLKLSEILHWFRV